QHSAGSSRQPPRSGRLSELPGVRRRAFLNALIERVDGGANQIDMRLRSRRLSALLDIAATRARLSDLAPDITQAILDGRQPRDLTAEKLLEHSRLPLAWHDQRTALG